MLHFLGANIACQFAVSGVAWLAVSLDRTFAVASLIGNSNFTFIAITGGKGECVCVCVAVRIRSNMMSLCHCLVVYI